MSNYLQNRRILIGISGGIAAYKILELIRRLRELNCNIHVVMTSNATQFVTPLSIEALGAKISLSSAMQHIDLARWAEVVLIAPASANIIAKCANGLADDLLSTLLLATSVPVLIAPAMNQQMWNNIATQHNIEILKQRNFSILEPNNGPQACGEIGPGRMQEAAQLLNALDHFFSPKILSGKHVVITAGPTQEAIDPVRFLSNHSSGKMGYALAQSAIKMGATVSLISGPTTIDKPNCTIINVITAKQMHSSTLELIENNKTDYFIGCAAVSDYRPKIVKQQKIKKTTDNLILELEPNPDILKSVANLPGSKRPFVVGFAAETENLVKNASNKLHAKNLDLIVANLVAKNLGFCQENNSVQLIDLNGLLASFEDIPKTQLAVKILEVICQQATIQMASI